MVKISGHSLYYLKKYIIGKISQEFFDDIVSKLEPELQKIWQSPIMAKEFYNLDAEIKMIEAVASKYTLDEVKLMAKDDVSKQLSGIYGFVVKFLSLDTIIGKMQKMWDQDFSQGKIEVAEKKDSFYRLRVSDFPYTEIYRRYHEFYFKEVCEIVTGKKFTSSSETVSDGVSDFTLTQV